MELIDLIGSEAETPEYQRIIALNIQVPHTKGKRSYYRVTITSSLKDLGNDLGLVLPNNIRRLLESEHELSYKHSRHEMSSPNPRRDPYVAVCSCGEPECDHVQYALSHFQRVVAFSQNSGHIAQQLRDITELMTLAEQQRTTLEQRLGLLKLEHDKLVDDLEKAGRDDLLVAELRDTLKRKENEIELLSFDLDEKAAEIDRHKQESETAQDNLRSMSKAWLLSGKRRIEVSEVGITDDILRVINTHFVLDMTSVQPAEKLQDNVFSDHHRVANTRQVLPQLAQLEFVRELGIGYRHQTKSGKVQVMPEVDILEVLIPHDGEADIIRVLTTARSRPQQMLAAYMIAERWDLQVQY